jgi:predicted DNA-binding transcriptional regulator YafY
MSDVRMTPESFSERTSEVLADSNQAQETEKWIDVCLKISTQGAHRVYDEFDEKDIVKNEDGSFTITASLPENKWLISYLLSFSADAEVLSPQNIRDMLRYELAQITRKYQKIT